MNRWVDLAAACQCDAACRCILLCVLHMDSVPQLNMFHFQNVDRLHCCSPPSRTVGRLPQRHDHCVHRPPPRIVGLAPHAPFRVVSLARVRAGGTAFGRQRRRRRVQMCRLAGCRARNTLVRARRRASKHDEDKRRQIQIGALFSLKSSFGRSRVDSSPVVPSV